MSGTTRASCSIFARWRRTKGAGAQALHDVFGPEFLIRRPLLQALDAASQQAPVLLIDELDRADAEFEAYLLELLNDYQITIPEIGTFRAAQPPIVILTSNRTRDIHDALRRRCLYYWIEYPSLEKEYTIVRTRVPEAPDRLARQVVSFVQTLRGEDLFKAPGVAETLDWLSALVTLGQTELTEAVDARLARRAAQVSGRHPEGDWRNLPRAAGGEDSRQRERRSVSDETPGANGARATSGDISLNDVELARGELLLARILDFGRFLWELGLDIGPGRMVEVVEGLPLIDIGVREDFYTFLKVSLVSKREQLATFDDAFAYFWLARSMPATDLPPGAQMRRRNLALPSHRMPEQDKAQERLTLAPSSQQRHPQARIAEAARQERQEEEENAERTGTYSHEELLRRKDFEEFTYDELQEAQALMARLRWRLGLRVDAASALGASRPRARPARARCARACAPAASRSPCGGASIAASHARWSSSATSAAR